MKNIFNLLLAIVLIAFFSCKKDSDDDNSNNNGTQPTPIDNQASVDNAKRIAAQGHTIIYNAIDNAVANDDLIDPSVLANDIMSIDGVSSATPTSTGTGFVIKQDDGSYSNLILVSQTDARMFKEVVTDKGQNPAPMQKMDFLSVNPVTPSGSGKALILAPFQYAFNTELNQIKTLMETAGYTVEMFMDNAADLDHFRGDFIDDYDIVFIRTHGAANFANRNGDLSTVLLTGEKISDAKLNSLTADEQLAIAVGGHGGDSYYALTVQWLNLTHNNNFPNSWIYAGGCETAKVDNGPTSLSEAFLNLGAIGYNGFNETILTAISNPVAEKMTAEFTSGLSFNDASDKVRNDWGLIAKSWLLRLKHGSAANVNHFDNNQDIGNPFYLFDPQGIVGVAAVIPDAGAVGTAVVFEVTIKPNFVNQVDNIEFDIDNTGEHLVMTKVSANLWRRDNLAAPIATVYPRIDTFTFTAFDSNGNILGQGSATFSILETKNSTHNSKYYAGSAN